MLHNLKQKHLYILCHKASSSVSFKSPSELLHYYPLPQCDLVLLCPGPCSTLHLNVLKSNSDLHNPSSAVNVIRTFKAILSAWEEEVGDQEEEEER